MEQMQSDSSNMQLLTLMERNNDSSSVNTVDLKSHEGKIYVNYYFAIAVLTVILANLVLMIYYQPA